MTTGFSALIIFNAVYRNLSLSGLDRAGQFFIYSTEVLILDNISIIVANIISIVSFGTVTFNPITWLPILATSLFTWVIDSEDIIKFKNVMILTVCMWFVYDAVHLNFISAAFDAFTVFSTGYSVWQIKKEQKAAESK